MKQKITLRFFSLLCILLFHNVNSQNNNYEIGVGISDVTGQIAESNFFGYAEVFFRNSGMKDRQYSRAYIIKEPNGKPVVFVSIDKGATFQSINTAVLDKLQALYGDLYTDTNLIITATHTHTSPGGYSFYSLYNISSGGFNKANFDNVVDGIVTSIQKAHESMAPGRIYYNIGSLDNANINRSLVAYVLNKDADKFPNTDNEMTVLKFVQGQNKEIGMISWFAVHPTSLSKTYKFCSGDNKGYASLKFERAKNSSYNNDENTFVAAFPNTNPGDMSPNMGYMPGPDDPRATSIGPGKDEEESSEIVGQRQYEKAIELYNTASKQLVGSIKAVSRFNDFSNTEVAPKYTDGEIRYTCKAQLGLSFRAGAEDGRTPLSKEGRTSKHPERSCHAEKALDVIFNMGANEDNPGSQKILPSSIMKIGQLGILAAPGEFTIMAGRRAKATVAENKNTGLEHLIFCGYSDSYAGYVTTREEYSSQQYEGASTHFGPWTLAAYRQEFERLAEKLANSNSNPWPDAEPELPVKKPIGPNVAVNILFDDKPLSKSFGDVDKDVHDEYHIGDTAKVVFWGGHPNHDLKTNGTYLKVERWNQENENWIPEYLDRDPNTRLEWKRDGIANSKIIIQWRITPETKCGYYRITHTGIWKNGWNGKLSPYFGESNYFFVKGNGSEEEARVARPPQKIIAKKAIKLIAYPNPTKDGSINIMNSENQNGFYEIRSITGEMVDSGNLIKESQKENILIEGKPGLYLLKISFDDGTIYKSTIAKE